MAEYAEARERWTWRNQVMNDEKTKILSPIQLQGPGACSYFALAVTLEANLRVQWERNVSLSKLHLEKLDEDSRTKLPDERGKVKRILRMIQDEGVFEDEHYEEILKHRRAERHARKYKVIRFYTYRVHDPEDIRRALYQLRRGGPLVAVFPVSSNYNDCKRSGLVYRFDPNNVTKDDDGRLKTHAVSVVSFAIEAKMPCLECQDSKGKHWGRNGFIVVDITSIVELYSIRVHLSS